MSILENTRFHAEEEANDKAFAKELAGSAEIYVNDAFGAAHRAHASTEGIARLLPAYPGLAMRRELDMLDAALGKPVKPVLGIVGGAKVSTKLDLLGNLVGNVPAVMLALHCISQAKRLPLGLSTGPTVTPPPHTILL